MESDRCRIKYVQDPVTGWKLRLQGECGPVLEKIKELPPRRRRYLERRIIKPQPSS